MKQKLLLTLFIASINLAVNAQKGTTYAITGSQKGQNNWTEVRQIDIATGEELKTVFKHSEETKILNARTGKPVVKKEPAAENFSVTRFSNGNVTISGDNNVRIITVRPEGASAPSPKALQEARIREVKREVIHTSEARINKVVIENDLQNNAQVIRVKPHAGVHLTPSQKPGVHLTPSQRLSALKEVEGKMQACDVKTIVRMGPSLDKPFSTYSAACAYDKKHERLYYTPMGIAQLRYIDLKSKTPQVFYFEDEQFGALRHRGDVPNQITRMVIGSDGNGYALTNNADHLIRFTTDKKATITDLGALTDDASNGNYSVRSSGGYGGDIIAAKSGDLYLITSNRNVFQIDIKSMAATYKGTIQGLPRGYSTNGAAVEDGNMVLVNSSNSTQGYYRFDITKFVAEKVGNSESVFNASDLANSNLLAVKKEEKPKETVPDQLVEIAPLKEKSIEDQTSQETRIAVYPNPVTNGIVNLLLDNYTPGKYLAKLIDVSGKQLNSKNFTITSKSHKEPFNLPSIAKGNYLIQIYNQANLGAGIVKLVVQ